MKTVKDVMDEMKYIAETADRLNVAYNKVNIEVNCPLTNLDPDWKPEYIPDDKVEEYRRRRAELRDAIYDTVVILSEYKSMLEKMKVNCEE